MTLDFIELADGIKRSNVGVGGIQFEAVATLQGGTAVLEPTQQAFRLRGAPGSDAPPTRYLIRVLDWRDPTKIGVEILREIRGHGDSMR